jgi:protein tyrosine phosphatase (PTP) superfamily phosphohydrolase (DUF442 family)
MPARLLILVATVAVPLAVAPGPRRPVPVHADGLHNAFRLSPGLYSGSQPDGDAGFASLARLGVRTVVSVDGATPDVGTAARHGLRYVHLPVGYDGVPRDQAIAAARAVRELPGPAYLHCHHGKHRGPAVAACVLLALGDVTAAEAAEVLRIAGTDPKYRGLTAVPQAFAPPTAAEWAAPVEFPATAAVPDLARLMVQVDERWDRLKADPTADDAVQLAELYREAARLPAAAPMLSLMRAAEANAAALARSPADRGRLAAGQRLCNRCHADHRDRPGR